MKRYFNERLFRVWWNQAPCNSEVTGYDMYFMKAFIPERRVCTCVFFNLTETMSSHSCTVLFTPAVLVSVNCTCAAGNHIKHDSIFKCESELLLFIYYFIDLFFWLCCCVLHITEIWTYFHLMPLISQRHIRWTELNKWDGFHIIRGGLSVPVISPKQTVTVESLHDKCWVSLMKLSGVFFKLMGKHLYLRTVRILDVC